MNGVALDLHLSIGLLLESRSGELRYIAGGDRILMKEMVSRMRGVCNSFLSFSRSIASMPIISEIRRKPSLLSNSRM